MGAQMSSSPQVDKAETYVSTPIGNEQPMQFSMLVRQVQRTKAITSLTYEQVEPDAFLRTVRVRIGDVEIDADDALPQLKESTLELVIVGLDDRGYNLLRTDQDISFQVTTGIPDIWTRLLDGVAFAVRAIVLGSAVTLYHGNLLNAIYVTSTGDIRVNMYDSIDNSVDGVLDDINSLYTMFLYVSQEFRRYRLTVEPSLYLASMSQRIQQYLVDAERLTNMMTYLNQQRQLPDPYTYAYQLQTYDREDLTDPGDDAETNVVAEPESYLYSVPFEERFYIRALTYTELQQFLVESYFEGSYQLVDTRISATLLQQALVLIQTYDLGNYMLEPNVFALLPQEDPRLDVEPALTYAPNQSDVVLSEAQLLGDQDSLLFAVRFALFDRIQYVPDRDAASLTKPLQFVQQVRDFIRVMGAQAAQIGSHGNLLSSLFWSQSSQSPLINMFARIIRTSGGFRYDVLDLITLYEQLIRGTQQRLLETDIMSGQEQEAAMIYTFRQQLYLLERGVREVAQLYRIVQPTGEGSIGAPSDYAFTIERPIEDTLEMVEQVTVTPVFSESDLKRLTNPVARLQYLIERFLQDWTVE